jgi:sugar phosphate isomerase/epimerase
MSAPLSRRALLATTALAAAAPTAASIVSAQPPVQRDPGPAFRYCLNMSTIRGQKLTPPQQVEVAAKAGYQAIEPWIRDLDAFVQQGGSLSDLNKQIADAGLTVASAIAFAEWIVDNDAQRAKGLETAKRDMDVVRKIGGNRIAAPPTGATKQSDLNLFRAAERYRALLEAGRQIGVTPQLELWGFSQSLSRLGELMFVSVESADPDACVLPDVYHIYKGGSDFQGLKMINGRAMHVFHMNDYPAEPERAKITDAHRVYPGDGVAPLSKILRSLYDSGFRGTLSLELFNPEYWKQDALTVARTGLEKMKASVVATGV